MSALMGVIRAFLVLMAFGVVAWLYTTFGRIYVGLNGWNETILIGIALWTVKETIASVVSNLMGPVEKAVNKVRAAVAN